MPDLCLPDDWNDRRPDGTIDWGPDTFRSSLVALQGKAHGRVIHEDERPAPVLTTTAEKRAYRRKLAKRGIRALAAAIRRAA